MKAAILVTGGAGFIGSTFVRAWLCRELGPVVNLDKLTYAGNLESLGEVFDDPQHTFVQADIGDREAVRDLLKSFRPWAVVNFAAESHVDRSIDGPAPFINTNVIGTCSLLEEVRLYWSALVSERRDRFRFLHISTDEVYGALGPVGRFAERSPYCPSSPYAASKAAGDHFVHAYHHTFGLPTLITHASNTYGPYQFPEKLIPLVTLNAFEGRPLPVYGDGRQVRDWLFVQDHCRALRRILRRAPPGSVYNIGAGAERSNLDVVKSICRCVDRLRPDLAHRPCRSLITFVADRPGHDGRYAVNASHLRRDLHWRPRIDFDEGLLATVDWYLKNPDWVEHVTTGKYRRERLGLVAAAS